MSLAGKRIVNTRAFHQAAEFDILLRARGAIPLDYPCIAILPPEDTTALDQALSRPFDLLVLTSANTVMILAQRLQALGRSLHGMKAVGVGSATAQAAREQLGVEIVFIPIAYTTRALAEGLAITLGTRVLLAQSEIAPPILAGWLRSRGANLTALTAYRTVRGSGGVELTRLLRDGQVDAVTFTSSSTARYFVERLSDEGGELSGVWIATIGTQTSQTARACGLTVTVEAETHTLVGLTDALSDYFEARD